MILVPLLGIPYTKSIGEPQVPKFRFVIMEGSQMSEREVLSACVLVFQFEISSFYIRCMHDHELKTNILPFN